MYKVNKFAQLFLENFIIFLLKIKYIFLQKKTKEIIQINPFILEKYKFIAIFASFSNEQLDESTEKIIALLRKKEAYIIFSTNNPNTKFIKNKQINVFISHNNCGRDFGQFKTATKYIYQNISSEITSKVVYLNDSVFYFDSNINFIDKFLDENYDFISTFENSGNQKNKWFLSSWMFSVSKNLFTSEIYKKFFDNYLPINHKSYAVNYGEKKLTEVALIFNARIKAIYSNESLLTITKKYIDKVGPLKLLNKLPFSIRNDFINSEYSNDMNNLYYFIYTNLFKYSPTHIFNLLLLEMKLIPFLKKDLFFCGAVSEDHFFYLGSILRKLTDDSNKLRIETFFRLRGKPSDFGIWRLLKVKLGLL
jgi:hypothetical protein